MKICPVCRQTYTDDTLNFCLNDGTVLSAVNNSSNDQQTVYMGQASPASNRVGIQTNQLPKNQNAVPKKKSRAWIWVVGVVGGVILLGVIGFIGLIGLALSLDNSNTNTNASNIVRNTNSSGTRNTGSLTDDFSSWRRETNDIGSSDFKNGELVVSSKLENYYYVLMTRNNDFLTSDATTSVTVRNIEGKFARYGFGLVVKAVPANSTRYAYLIDTSKQLYRIVLHTNNKENTVVNWTKTAAIKTGTDANILKVEDKNGTMTFYINGQLITTVKDSTGLKNGVAGIYASGAVPIGFSDLQITK